MFGTFLGGGGGRDGGGGVGDFMVESSNILDYGCHTTTSLQIAKLVLPV